MAWLRRLYESRRTKMMSLPSIVVSDMGLAKGDQVRLEHPFSDMLIVTSDALSSAGRAACESRGIGWCLGADELHRYCTLVGEQSGREAGVCDVCRGWRSEVQLGVVSLCSWCARELGFAIAFRMRPTQVELELRVAGDSGELSHVGPAPSGDGS